MAVLGLDMSMSRHYYYGDRKRKECTEKKCGGRVGKVQVQVQVQVEVVEQQGKRIGVMKSPVHVVHKSCIKLSGAGQRDLG